MLAPPSDLLARAKKAGPLWLVPAAVLALVVYQSSAGLNRPVIRSDGEGYYAYLRLYLIQHRLDFADLPMRLPPAVYGFRIHPRTGRLADIYPIGTALCMAPFFAVGHAAAVLGGWKADGWSEPYQWAILIAGICWLSIGMWAAFRVVANRTAPKPAAAAVVVMGLGTNLLHYAIAEPSMSHIYAFGTVAVLLWLGDRFWAHATALGAAALGAACALLFSIRHYDVLLAAVALYPVVWKSNRLVLRRYWSPFLASTAIVLLPHLTVSTYYLGAPWETTYWGLAIHWTHPRFLAMLFSVGRGWWFWNPVAALGVGGLVAGLFHPKLRWFCAAAVFVITVTTYILACWSSETFGDGFGHRMYVDLLPLTAVGLALSLNCARRPAYYMIVLNLYLMLAYWNGYIGGSGTTWRSYVKVLRMPFRAALGIEPPADSEHSAGLAAEVTITGARREPGAIVIDAIVRNTGSAVWLADPGIGKVYFAVRTFATPDCQGTSFGDWRYPIASNIAPGQAGSVRARIPEAITVGHLDYYCGEMMASSVAWFRDLGSSGRPASVRIDR